MKILNYFKFKKYLNKSGLSLQDILSKIELSSDDFLDIEKSGEIDEEILQKFAAEFNISTDQLTDRTYVLEDLIYSLIEMSWSENLGLDSYHIISDHIKNLILTTAECILIYEGTQTGIANCTLQVNSHFEFEANESGIKNNIIRSEIMEWLLGLETSRIFIKTGSITIIGAEFKRTKQQHNRFARNKNSLELSDRIINIDLVFRNCSFFNGIDLSNAQTNGLTFDGCIFGSKFIGDRIPERFCGFNGTNLVVNGDIKFFSGIAEKDSISRIGNQTQHYDNYGSIRLEHASIGGFIEINGIILRGSVNANHLTCNEFTIRNSDIMGGIYIQKSIIKGMTSVWLSKVFGNFTANNIQSGTIEVKGSIFLGTVNLAHGRVESYVDLINSQFYDSIRMTYLSCLSLKLSSSENSKRKFLAVGSVHLSFLSAKVISISGDFLGFGVSIDAPCLKAQLLDLKNINVLHGAEFHKANIENDIKITRAFIGKSGGLNSAAILLSGCLVSNILLNTKLVVIGQLKLSETSVKNNLDFSTGIFLSKDCTIDARNISVGKRINFKPDLSKILLENDKVQPDTKSIIEFSHFSALLMLINKDQKNLNDYFKNLDDKENFIIRELNFTDLDINPGVLSANKPLANLTILAKNLFIANIYFLFKQDPQGAICELKKNINQFNWLSATDLRKIDEAIVCLEANLTDQLEIIKINLNTNFINAEKYTKVIGETTFEWANVEGHVDCSGSSFYNDIKTQYSRPDELKKIGSWLVNRVKPLKIILLILLLPVFWLQEFFTTLLKRSMQLMNIGKTMVRRKNISYGLSSQQWVFLNKVLNLRIEKIRLRSAKKKNDALSFRNSKVKGELYLNNGLSFPGSKNGENLPVVPVGIVDMRSANINSLYINPDIGCDHTQTNYKVTGLKYEYIYADERPYKNQLAYCKWFYTDLEEDNFKQPYEQLASTYVKMGDDGQARQVLMRTPGKTIPEKILISVISLIAWLAIPAYRAFFSLLVLWAVGVVVFGNAEGNELVSVDKEPKVKFSATTYSAQLLIPFISTQQKDAYTPNYDSKFTKPLYINYRSSICPSYIPPDIKVSAFVFYHNFHALFGTILLSFFLLGIARIVRNT